MSDNIKTYELPKLGRRQADMEGMPGTDIVGIIIGEFRGLRQDVQDMAEKLSEMVGVMRNHEKTLEEMKNHSSRLDKIETRMEESEKARREMKLETDAWKDRNSRTIMGILALIITLFSLIVGYLNFIKH